MRRLPAGFQREGDVVALLGAWEGAPGDLGGSTYLKVLRQEVAGRPPTLDLGRERAVQHLCLEAFRAGLLRSAHDCSDGGLAVALAESCIWGNIGIKSEPDIQLSNTADAVDLKVLAWYFGEVPSRIIVSLSEDAWPELSKLAEGAGVPLKRLGVVGGARFSIGRVLDVLVADLARAWQQGLGDALHGPLA